MSPRRTILRELRNRRDQGPERYARPATIPGFDQNPGRYQEAINRLLQERLINGTKDEDGRLAIALNEHRLADVSKELRAWFARPAIWIAAILAVGILVVGMALQA